MHNAQQVQQTYKTNTNSGPHCIDFLWAQLQQLHGHSRIEIVSRV